MQSIKKVYVDLYDSLSNLKNKMHRNGRLDDANAKLDELVKVLAICLATSKHWIDSNSIERILQGGQTNKNFVKDLKQLFKKTSELQQFKNNDGTSIFGANPSINIQNTENDFAFSLLESINKAFTSTINTNKSNHPFDLLNESFGHFIRDNFRNNIEDAQYMTPPEVVNFICQWTLNDILNEDKKLLEKNFIVMDPSCGVGSFLASFYSHAVKKIPSLRSSISLVGQDKVDRMVRLSKINMMLFGSDNFHIECGNSLVNNQFLNNYNGKVDLIITNPPFNAKFKSTEINKEPKENFPLLNDINKTSTKIDSELLFIDREISLLKEGGRLFVVLPDSTISSHGLSATLRERLSKVTEIKGLIELPAVTFAQAGTRTKTVILYLQKKSKPKHLGLTLVSTIHSLGFDVSIRKGVTIKKYQGVNELESLIAIIKKNKNIKKRKILLSNPSCVLEDEETILAGAWTPSHYSSKRIKSEIKISKMKGFKSIELQELVNIETKKRRRFKEEDGSKCISILHIIGDGFINVNELISYAPKTKGTVCYPGDILYSKINPRITRVIVVPNFDFPLTCSPEFEIMSVKDNIDSYWLSYLLQEPLVQDQLQSLTSGTSSSHNRIKTNDLLKVKIPVPISVEQKNEVENIVKIYQQSITSLIDNTIKIYKLRNYITKPRTEPQSVG